MSNISHTASQFHKDQLLEWFMYHMSMEQRSKLVAELPAAYNSAVGQEVMVVVRKSDVEHLINPVPGMGGLHVAPFCFTGRPAIEG
jgi:hypothetical protein